MRETAARGWQLIGTLDRIMKSRSVSMGVKRGIRNSIILTTWTWNAVQQAQIRTVELSNIRGASRMIKLGY